MSDSLWPHGQSPWDFSGKNTGVGCHFLLQEIFPTQGLKPGLPHCRLMLYHLSHQGSHKKKTIILIIFRKDSWSYTELLEALTCVPGGAGQAVCKPVCRERSALDISLSSRLQCLKQLVFQVGQLLISSPGTATFISTKSVWVEIRCLSSSCTSFSSRKKLRTAVTSSCEPPVGA